MRGTSERQRNRVLVAVAVAAEREAVERTAPWADVTAVGVGPGAAGAGAATALVTAAYEGRPYGLVVSAGIGGGFAAGGVEVGDTVIADRIVAADLGAQTPTGFASVAELGFGTAAHQPPPDLVRAAVEATGRARAPC